MATLSDRGLSTLQQSAEFLNNTNYAVHGPFDVAGFGVKNATIDEFIHALPFEAWSLDPLGGVTLSRPNASEPTPAYLPGLPISGSAAFGAGAEWFPPNSAVPELGVYIEETINGTYEKVYFKRLGTQVQIDRLQAQILQQRAANSTGPDPIPTLIRSGSLAVVRQLSRDAINCVDTTTYWDGDGQPIQLKMTGLARYYNDEFGGIGADAQVVKYSGGESLVKQARRLLRRVSPSGDGFGIGANCLLMSWRTRDLLIAAERTEGIYPLFFREPDGEMRYYFHGVPVFVGPVREDEDTSGSTPAFPEQTSIPSPYTYNASSIYALRLGGPTGIRMMHVGGQSAQFGIQVEDIASGTSVAAIGYKVHGYYALYVPERQAGARLWGVDISGETD